MRLPWQVLCLAVLVCPQGVQAGDPAAGSCEAAIGAWEMVAPSPSGRGVILKQGSTYHAAIVWSPDASSAPVAAAQECSCAGSAGKLQWNCRVVVATRQSDVGAEWKFEWNLEGESAKSWGIRPDGTRDEPVYLKLLKQE